MIHQETHPEKKVENAARKRRVGKEEVARKRRVKRKTEKDALKKSHEDDEDNPNFVNP